MIIDFHTHTFPDTLAKRAITSLAKSARAKNYVDGTLADLRRSMQQSGVSYSVLLPVVTKPAQQEIINQNAITVNETTNSTGILSFGGIHPDNENYREILRHLADSNVKGIKLHPVFQKTNVDDIRFLRIIEYACEQNLIILLHAGYDISFMDMEYASISRIVTMLDTLHPSKMILAHMGGWGCWKEVETEILGRDVWLDTAFSLLPITPAPNTKRKPDENPPLSQADFIRFVRIHGSSRILFGTDSPWDAQSLVIQAIRNTTLTPEEQSSILGENAAKLLSLSEPPSGLLS